MDKALVLIDSFSKNRTRTIATVVKHVPSAHYSFAMADDSPQVPAHIAIVDADDPPMLELLGTVLQRRPELKVLYLVGSSSPEQLGPTLLAANLVTQLIPNLEQLARAIAPQALGRVRPMAAAPAPKVVQLVPVRKPAERLRALVVDDSPTVRMQLSRIVERMGLNCDAVDSADAALGKLEAQTYNLIFVDVVMPGMDGYQLTREIKRSPSHRQTAVIMLTGKSSPFDRARGALTGCDTYLTKPVELRRLYEATVQCLCKKMAVSDVSDWVSDPTARPDFAQPSVARASATPPPAPALNLQASAQPLAKSAGRSDIR